MVLVLFAQRNICPGNSDYVNVDKRKHKQKYLTARESTKLKLRGKKAESRREKNRSCWQKTFSKRETALAEDVAAAEVQLAIIYKTYARYLEKQHEEMAAEM